MTRSPCVSEVSSIGAVASGAAYLDLSAAPSGFAAASPGASKTRSRARTRGLHVPLRRQRGPDATIVVEIVFDVVQPINPAFVIEHRERRLGFEQLGDRLLAVSS